MAKRFFVSPLLVITVAALLLVAAPEGSGAQETTHDARYYNKLGLSYFNEAYYELTPKGRRQEAIQRYEQAIAAYKRAIAIDDAYVDGHRNLARVYYVQKRYSDAAQVYKRVTALNPSDIDAYVKLASVYAQLQMYPEAIEQLEKAKSFTTDDIVLRQLDGFIEKLE